MKRIEADLFLKEIKTVYVEKPNKYLTYAIQKTISNLEDISKEIAEKYKSLNSKEFFDLEQGRLKIVEKYFEKGEDGNPVIEGDYYKVDKKFEQVLSEEMNQYQEDNKELIQKYNDTTKTFDEYLSEDVGEVVVKVSIKNFPEYLDQNTFKILSKLIKESDKEVSELAD